MNTVFVIFLCALLFFLWTALSYKKLIRLHFLVKEGWSDVDVQLKRRHDLIPHLVSVVKQYSIHEKEIIETIARMRAVSMGSKNSEEKGEAEGTLTSMVKRLFSVVDNNADLKANQSFAALQKELSVLEEEIQLARHYYNGTVREYNSALYTVWCARFFGFKPAHFFELDTPQDRSSPPLEF